MRTMLRPLSREEVRSIDARAAEEMGLPTLVLMENAGRGAADWLRSRLPVGARVALACGPGNNGGDAAVVARHLDAWGYDVRVAWFADPLRLRGDALVQYEILHRSGIEQVDALSTTAPPLATHWEGADWLVDGLFGTGLTRPVEGALAEAIESMNEAGSPILALDLPSGLDCDTGEPLGSAIRARATATFVAPKFGFLDTGSHAYTGEVVVVDIGVPRVLLAPFLR